MPVPGGPKSKIPLGGLRKPVNMSGLSKGYTTASFIIDFAYSNPAISFQSDIKINILECIGSMCNKHLNRITLMLKELIC